MNLDWKGLISFLAMTWLEVNLSPPLAVTLSPSGSEQPAESAVLSQRFPCKHGYVGDESLLCHVYLILLLPKCMNRAD